MKILSLLLLIALGPVVIRADESRLPRIERDGAQVHWLVDGEPFLIRGGEVGNSTHEPATLRPHWDTFQDLGLNALLVPVSWESIEPTEGAFDFAIVDELIADAREHGMRLVILWFGAWKNSMSSYTPAWVKLDTERFPRAADRQGRTYEILSPFHEATLEADSRAFGALLGHLRDHDPEHTVIGVQVENEIGMIPDARDFSAAANAAYREPVPEALLEYLDQNEDSLEPSLRRRWLEHGRRAEGGWETVFGSGAATEELFMAWHFARFVEELTSIGKATYPIPHYVNAALIRPGYQPGQYPSAGPLPHLFDVWRAGVPSLDFMAPDIYFPEFAKWTGLYARHGNPLFVPETLRSPAASVNALYAFGEHGALGFSPFAIEGIKEPAASLLRDSYSLIAELEPLLHEHQGQGTTAGLLPPGEGSRQPLELRLGDYILHVSFEEVAPPSLADGGLAGAGSGSMDRQPLPAGGMVIAEAPDTFIVAGMGVTVTFSPIEPNLQAGILHCSEGRIVEGEWEHVRSLNGDQTHQGRHLRLLPGEIGMQRIRLYTYE